MPEGGTARFDVDLRSAEGHVLAGRLTVDGEGGRGTATLLPGAATGSWPERSIAMARASLEPDGSFELRVRRGGRALLVVGDVDGRSGAFHAFVDLAPGRTSWSLEVETGTAEVGPAPELEDGTRLPLELRVPLEGAEYVRFLGRSALDETVFVEGVPLGTGTLRRAASHLRPLIAPPGATRPELRLEMTEPQRR